MRKDTLLEEGPTMHERAGKPYLEENVKIPARSKVALGLTDLFDISDYL